jgi:hypothetical protein
MAFLVATVAGGCSYGMKVATFVPASGPRGILCRVSLDSTRMEAELIEVRDTGLVVLTNPNAAPSSSVDAVNVPRLRLLPYGSIRSARFEQTNLAVGGGSVPAPKTLRRLRLLSRFPQGIGPDLLESLLRAYGQTQVDGTRP